MKRRLEGDGRAGTDQTGPGGRGSPGLRGGLPGGWANEAERDGDAEAGINGVLKSLGGPRRLGALWVVRSARADFDLTQRIGTCLTGKGVCCGWVDFKLSGPEMDSVLVVRWRLLTGGRAGGGTGVDCRRVVSVDGGGAASVEYGEESACKSSV